MTSNLYANEINYHIIVPSGKAKTCCIMKIRHNGVWNGIHNGENNLELWSKGGNSFLFFFLQQLKNPTIALANYQVWFYNLLFIPSY